MSRAFLPAAALIATIVAATPRGQTPETGSIGGTVKLTTKTSSASAPSTAYSSRSARPHDTHPIPEIQNVVVYLKGAVYRGTLPVKRASLRQEHETFVPHVLAVTRGSTVDFPNEDSIYHNVFSLSSAASFNLGRYTTGKSKFWPMNKAGIVKVFCDIHSHMSATIMVFDHPYFTIPGDDGAYELPNVPAGDYTVVGWHERVGERVIPIKVERGKRAAVDLKLPLQEAP